MGKQNQKKRGAATAEKEPDEIQLMRSEKGRKKAKKQKTEEVKSDVPLKREQPKARSETKRKQDMDEDGEEDHDLSSDVEEADIEGEQQEKTQNQRNKKKARQSLPSIPAGEIVVGRVDLENPKIKLPTGSLLIQFRGGLGKRFGRVDFTQVADPDKWSDNPFDSFKHGQFVKCVVLKSNPSATTSSVVELSIRPSLVDAAANLRDEKAKQEKFESELVMANRVPAHDELVTGFVIAANEKGCFIRVSRNLTGRVLLKNLSQGFVKDVAGEFPAGKLVAGRVLTSDETTGRFELTLRSSAVVGESEQRWAWNTLKSETVLDGIVHRIIPAGILVTLPSAGGLIGLCHISQVFDEDDPINSVDDKSKRKGKKRHHRSDGQAPQSLDEEQKQRLRTEIGRTYRVGDMVKCLVLEVDAEAKKMQLGMKPSYFQQLVDDTELSSAQKDIDEGDDEDNEEKEQEFVEGTNADEEQEDDDEEEEAGSEEGDEGDEGAGEVENELEEDQISESSEGELEEADDNSDDEQPMTLQAALKQTGASAKSDSAASLAKKLQASKQQLAAVEDDDQKSSSRVNNKRRDALKRKAEATTSELEERLVSNAAPETVEEFERALVSKRNSSLVWIQYISLLVSMAEMDKARAVGERALKAISPELEDERNNVWSALLSMELQFGTLDQAKLLFQRMIRSADEKWAHLTLCDAYWALPESYPDRLKLAEEAIRGAKKASKQQSAKVWIRHFRVKFDSRDMLEGRKLLKEALRFVPKHKQVKVMLAFARLEFSHENGDIERGRTIMEGILDNYPKRTDVWHVFIDLEIKYGTADKVRTLFERAMAMKMSTKKVKSLFKKWLQFESGPKGGGEAYIESVKERARKFVESLVGDSMDEEDEENDAQ